MAAVIIRKKDVERLAKDLVKKFMTFCMMSIYSLLFQKWEW